MSSLPIARTAGREAPAESSRVVPAVALATAASLAVFIAAQAILLLRAHHLLLQAYVLQSGPHFANEMVGSIWPDLLFGTGRFCGLMLAGITLAATGRRRLYAVPAVAWFLLSMSHGPALVSLPHPFPISVGWWPVAGTTITSPFVWMNEWVGSVIDYTLALLPAAVLLNGLGRVGVLRPTTGRAWARPRPASVATYALCGFVLVLTMLVGAMSVDILYPWALVPAMLPLFLFGALLGTRRRALLWTAVAVPFLMQGNLSAVLSPDSTFVRTLLDTLPFIGVVVLGMLPGPLARALERLRDAPLSALILLNVLNVADAALTWMAIDTQQASEFNPVVRMLGLPAKVMLVAAISLVLYRRQPRALAWTVLIFLGVIAWHVAGMYFTAHT